MKISSSELMKFNETFERCFKQHCLNIKDIIQELTFNYKYRVTNSDFENFVKSKYEECRKRISEANNKIDSWYYYRFLIDSSKLHNFILNNWAVEFSGNKPIGASEFVSEWEMHKAVTYDILKEHSELNDSNIETHIDLLNNCAILPFIQDKIENLDKLFKKKGHYSKSNLKISPQLKEEAKNWIDAPKLEVYLTIENELYQRGFIDENHKWLFKQKDMEWSDSIHKNESAPTKRQLVDLLKILIHNNFFKKIVNSKRRRYIHYRHFVSQRFGFQKTGLTETNKKYQPTLEEAEASFLWIVNLLKSPKST